MLAKLKPFLAIACLLLWMSPAFGQSQRVITIGYYDFPPSIYTDDQGHVGGPLVDVLKRMFERTDYVCRFKKLPIARLYSQLRTGDVDLWAGVPNKPELEGFVITGTEQLSTVDLNLYYLPETQPPSLPHDLRGQVTIMLNGFSYWPRTHELLLNPAHGVIQLRTNNRHSAVELLLRKRGTYFLDYKVPAESAFKEFAIDPLPFVPVESLPIVLVGSKQTDDIEKVIGALERAYRKMLDAGESVDLPK